MLYIWLMFYVNCISIKLERIARDDLLPTLLGVGFFRVEAWEREGGGSGLLTCMSTCYCWQSIPGIAGSRWLHVTLVISAVTVTTTKVTVLSFPPSLSNENNFSQGVAMSRSGTNSNARWPWLFHVGHPVVWATWPPGQVLQLLLRLWPPCFSMQSCKKRWCPHLPTSVGNRACPGVAPSSSNHCTPRPLQALLSWAISRPDAGTRLLAQVHPETSQHSSV